MLFSPFRPRGSDVWPSVVLISPLRNAEKHPANPLAVTQRFLNFGALALAGHLTTRGHRTVVLDEYGLAAGESLRDGLLRIVPQTEPFVVGVSCVSAYSADRAREVLREVAAVWPSAVRVIGGQHFVGYWGAEFTDKMPEADVLITGEAESAAERLVTELAGGCTLHDLDRACIPSNVYWRTGTGVVQGCVEPHIAHPLDEFISPDYGLYPGSEELFPSIEFSRGCTFSCVFCANSRENKRSYRRATADAIDRAVRRLLSVRRERPLRFYLQASNFAVDAVEAAELASRLSRYSGEIAWRTEMRVDSVERTVMRDLYSSGLRVLDLGLESASPRVLRIMNKTRDPVSYLAAARGVLRAASSAGIFTKVNYLVHPGDNEDSVQESWDWLLENSGAISAVSSGVTLEYPGTPLSRHLERYTRDYGTRRLPHRLQHWGVHHLQPSRELTLERAQHLSVRIAQSLQDRRGFALSKAFGYVAPCLAATDLLTHLPEASHATPYRE